MGNFLSCWKKNVRVEQDAHSYYPLPENMQMHDDILTAFLEQEKDAKKRDPECVAFDNIRYALYPPPTKPAGLWIRVPPTVLEDDDPGSTCECD